MKRYSLLILVFVYLLLGLSFTSTAKTCSLISPDRYWELSKEEINVMSNGCGTNSFHVPSKLYGLEIEDT